MTCQEKILSEEYGELIFDFTADYAKRLQQENVCFTPVDDRYNIFYVRQQEIERYQGSLYLYQYLTKVYGLMAEEFDPISLESAGILAAQRPPLSLTGEGVVLAFIDTGIRFADSVFRDESGQSRIIGLWDQTLQSGTPPEGFQYGSYYTKADIDAALRSENPYAEIPSYDTNGHGTAMAGVAAGSVVTSARVTGGTVPLEDAGGNAVPPVGDAAGSFYSSYRGAAPRADIVVVKLREAKRPLRNFYNIPEDVPAYAETDIMLGIKFAESFAETFKRPVVICLGMGSNSGNHGLGSDLAQYLNSLAQKRSRAVVLTTGNEGNAAHHFSGYVPEGEESYETVEIRVGEGEQGFLMEMWGKVPDTLFASIRTPGGEVVPRFRLTAEGSQTFSFIYERTRIIIDSILVEPNTGEELITFRFDAPTPGVWNIRVYNLGPDRSRQFHLWLPITQFLRRETYFLRPDPYTTLTDPSMTFRAVTVSSYNDANNSFYENSGRGFLSNGLIKPDVAAPGVNVSTPVGKVTGGSVAAALTAGGVAQFMEWAVVRFNSPSAGSQEIKNYLIRGANRNSSNTYPNREWGYGRLDIDGTFTMLSQIQR